MKKLPDITTDELMKEIDSLRPEHHYNKRFLTDDQLKILVYARKSDKPVSWRKLEELAKRKKWAVCGQDILRQEYKRALLEVYDLPQAQKQYAKP
jgi:hypothetical protein